jgi:hypothetical protein
MKRTCLNLGSDCRADENIHLRDAPEEDDDEEDEPNEEKEDDEDDDDEGYSE